MILEDNRAELEFLEDVVTIDELLAVNKVGLGRAVDAGVKVVEDDRADKEGSEDKRDVVIEGRVVVVGARELVMAKGGPLTG